MKKTILIAALFTAPFFLQAQSKLYIGTEANIVQDHFIINDEGNSLFEYPDRMKRLPAWSFLLGYQFNPYLSLETGLNFRPMSSGYKIEVESGSIINKGGHLYYQLPLRLRGRVPIFQDKLFATANVGVQFGFTNFPLDDEPKTGSGSGSATSDSQTLFSYNSITTSYNRSFLLVGGGLGLEFSLNPNFSIYSDLNYLKGFQTLHQIDINYQFGNQPTYKGTVEHQGTNLHFSLGLRYNLRRK